MSSRSPTPPSDHERNVGQALAPSPSASDSPDDGVTERQLSIYGTRKATLILHIIVVGCGIGGLSAAICLLQAGHRVTIVESSPIILTIGAGITLGPNSSRLLRRWGLADQLEKIAIKPEGVSIRRYSTGERIGFAKWDGVLEREYGAPAYQIHRADLHKILYDAVAPHITLLLDSTVVGCDPDPVFPSVTLKSGEVLKADLIIGADGLKSYMQQVVSGEPNPAEPTGDAAYRATIPSSLLMQDPELREFIEHPQLTSWLGPGRHLVTYPISGDLFNIVLLHPDEGSVESWTAEGNTDKMRQDFDDFEPRTKKFLGFVQSTHRWRLLDRKPLDKWTHASAPITLLGDACHPMLPYRALGAGMAIEDSAVLGNLLSRLSHMSQIRPLLEAYQDLRLDRTAMAQQSSRLSQHRSHLPDGPEQRARDENIRKAMISTAEREHSADSAGSRSSREPEIDIVFGYDADVEVDKWWAAHGKKLSEL